MESEKAMQKNFFRYEISSELFQIILDFEIIIIMRVDAFYVLDSKNFRQTFSIFYNKSLINNSE